MLIKHTIKTEVSCEEGRRYYLKIEWDKTRPCAMIIMMTAGETYGICFDKSTTLCLSNLISLGYGSCYIVNLFSSGEIREEINKEKF